MKHSFALFATTAILTAFQAQARSVTDFNSGWEFAPDGWNGAARKIDLPHDFQMEMPWDKEAGGSRGFKQMGAAWYRNSFVTPDVAGERVFLDFEGIMCIGDVWVNGKKVAASEYGYLGFEADVTQRLKPAGETNTVEVWTSTGHRYGSRWYTGGGLYRPVRIKTRPVRSIARHGIFVTTPEVSADMAKVRVQIELDGFMRCTNAVSAVVTIRDASGSVVGETQGAVPQMDYRKRVCFTPPDVTLERPSLWDIDSPSLHTAEVRLVQDGRTLDSDTARFGIRKIEFSPRFGFRLNGRKVFLKSMSNHSDYGAIGAAQFPRAIARTFRLMKRFGFNAVRCSHNPYSEDFYRMADEMGFIVVDEFIDKWSRKDNFWAGRVSFLSVWPELMTEWVRRGRNHPCIVLWSLGNELQQNEAYSGYDTGDWGVTTYRIFDTFAKRLDPTRLTTVGLFPSRAEAIYLRDPRYFKKPVRPPELADVMDVASFNYRYEDYPEYLKWNPNLIVFQSEASTSRWLDAYFGMDRERTVGVSWWGAIEYWGESDRWPKKGWCFSFFSHTLEPRPQAYLMKSGLLDVPLTRIGVVHDTGERLIWNDIHSGQYVLNENWNPDGKAMRSIFVFSNADEVELRLNGIYLGRKNTKNNVAEWKDIRYSPGKLEAIGANGSSHSIETTGEASSLRITDDTPDGWIADGTDLKYLRIHAVDAKGRHVPNASPQVSVSVEGCATLQALDDGDHFTDKSFHVREKTMKDGFLLAILRSGRTGGNVTVRLSAPGLPVAKATFKADNLHE